MLTAPSTPSSATGTDERDLVTAELSLGGMHCSACAGRIEGALAHEPGVVSASVNLATTRAFVAYDPATVGVEELCRAVDGAGYSASPVDDEGSGVISERSEHWGLRAAVSWPLALVAFGVSLFGPETSLAGWAVLLLAVTVEFAGGWPFLRTSARLLRRGATSMDTLIALGTLAALAVSAVEAIALGGRHVHIGGGGQFAARLLHAAVAVKSGDHRLDRIGRRRRSPFGGGGSAPHQATDRCRRPRGDTFGRHHRGTIAGIGY